MKRQILILSAACVTLTALADPNDPQVALVSASQDYERVLTIRYTLDEPAIVTFDVKTNGVSIGAEHLKTACGDLHRVVAATGEGETRTISWPAYESWPDHRFGRDVVSVTVTAWATNSPPDYMVIKLIGEDKGARTFYTSPEWMPGAGGVTNDMYKTDYLVMRRIPAAGKTFRMGSPKSEAGSGDYSASESLHYVTLTNDFYMSVFEFTAGQFRNITRNFDEFESDRAAYESTSICVSTEAPNLPIDCYPCSSLRGTGRQWPGDGHDLDVAAPLALIRSALGLATLDLPTESEWEFACRAGTLSARYDGTEYIKGNDGVASLAWYGSSWADVPHPVGLLKPNSYGLYDMYGNVAEWCLDRYTWVSASAGSTLIAPVGPNSSDTGTERVVRGYHVNCGGNTQHFRSAFRKNYAFDYSMNIWYDRLGYRLVCTF